jgi:hypothetical protein
LATWEGKPNTTVWASGDWAHDRGVQEVSGLDAKVELARQMGATEFFVPELQVPELQPQVSDIQIRPLTQGTKNPREALRAYLDRLEIPPGLNEPRAKRARYFEGISDDRKAKRYYRENILPDVVLECSEPLRRELSGAGNIKLITILSKGFELARLALSAIQPAECLLLHDKELAADAEELVRQLNAERPDRIVVPGLVSGDSRETLMNEFRREIARFIKEVQPETLVFDLTPGKRLMNLALYDALPPGSHVFCIQDDFGEGTRRPRPFSGEKPVHHWRAGNPKGDEAG